MSSVPGHDPVGAARAFVADIARRFEACAVEAARATWDFATTGLVDHAARKEAAEVELRLLFADDGAHHRIRVFDRQLSVGGACDPALRRQVRLIKLAYLEGQIEAPDLEEQARMQTSATHAFIHHRPVLEGRTVDDNALRAVLEHDPCPTRRQAAWEASRAIGERVAERLKQLVRSRNAAARRIGLRDHRAVALEVSELDEAWLDATLEGIDAATREPYARLKEQLDHDLARRFGVATEDLRPWHYPDLFFQELPVQGSLGLDELIRQRGAVELALDTFRSMDLDLDDALEQSDLEPRPGKTQHAFCLPVDRRRDVRVLASVTPNAYWAGTMLHELGHAAYELHVDRALPFLLRCPSHPFTTEGVAMLAGRMLHEPRWLREVAGLPAGVVDRHADELEARVTGSRLVFARWALALIAFERELYRDPDRDLDGLWWELVSRYQGLTRPEGRSKPDWAAKIHLATQPIYYQNYLLGELFASELSRLVVERTGRTLTGNRDAGALLVEDVFRPGASLRWDELVSQLFGRPLRPELYLAS